MFFFIFEHLFFLIFLHYFYIKYSFELVLQKLHDLFYESLDYAYDFLNIFTLLMCTFILSLYFLFIIIFLIYYYMHYFYMLLIITVTFLLDYCNYLMLIRFFISFFSFGTYNLFFFLVSLSYF